MSITELTALARQVERSDPHDPQAQGANLDRVCRIADQVRAHCAPEIASGLLATAHMLDVLASATDSRFDRKRVHDIACQLLRTMETAVQDFDETPLVAASGAALPAASQAPAPPPSPVVEPVVESERPPSQARATAPGEQDKKPRKETGRLLGRILLELGHVTRDHVADALRFHRAKGMPIGESLLLLGSISPDRLLEALKLQERLRTLPSEAADAKLEDLAAPKAAEAARAKPARGADLIVTKDMFLGEVLLGAEMITNDQLEQAMHLHHREGMRVGEALLRLGALTEEELAGGLELQRHLCSIAAKTARP